MLSSVFPLLSENIHSMSAQTRAPACGVLAAGVALPCAGAAQGRRLMQQQQQQQQHRRDTQPAATCFCCSACCVARCRAPTSVHGIPAMVMRMARRFCGAILLTGCWLRCGLLWQLERASAAWLRQLLASSRFTDSLHEYLRLASCCARLKPNRVHTSALHPPPWVPGASLCCRCAQNHNPRVHVGCI
jgi:hypothetical protein